MYIEDKHLWDKTGRTKRYVIQMLRDSEIAKIQSNRLKTSDLIEHCKIRQTAGASRLFEQSYSIEVAQVTGHRNLNILWQVYMQLFPHKLHDKFNQE